MKEKIKIIVCGALGKMGKVTVNAVLADKDLKLTGAIIRPKSKYINLDVGPLCELPETGVKLTDNLNEAILKSKPDVIVEFTVPDIAFEIAKTALNSGVRAVIGTTGMTKDEINEILEISNKKKTGAIYAPNFALCAVLGMKFAKEAGKYLSGAEIVEYHEHKKIDAPSGTSIKTADIMSEDGKKFSRSSVRSRELITGARGGSCESNIHIHSIRLPALVSHQEIIMGSEGQILNLRYDIYEYSALAPGIILAIKKIMGIDHFVYGLEKIL